MNHLIPPLLNKFFLYYVLENKTKPFLSFYLTTKRNFRSVQNSVYRAHERSVMWTSTIYIHKNLVLDSVVPFFNTKAKRGSRPVTKVKARAKNQRDEIIACFERTWTVNEIALQKKHSRIAIKNVLALY